MLKYLREKILDYLYGEKYIVNVKNVKLWTKVDDALAKFPDKSIPITIITGNEPYFNIVATSIQPQQRWVDFKMLQKGIQNIIIPKIVFHFFKNGGTMKEIDNYKTILKYGMLYGKKRRLTIT